MTPKLLRFQAFASYKNEQIINFEQLGANEIFLIHGKTGSGKTSILDAVTYALYGKSSGGGRGEIEDIRCKNYGARDIPTELEFVFEIKGRIYKFIRRVYERKKRSGCTELVSEHNALFYKEDRFFPFFENPTKTRVNEKAEELIGLTYNQFLQVVILPQGKFESFLVAPSKDKEEILVTLFQIDDWNKIGDWIFRQGAELEGKNVEKKGELSGILSQLECEKPEEIEDKNSGLEALVNQKYESLKAAIKVYESASVELEEMKQVAAYFEKRRNLEKQKDELLKRESEIEKLRIRLKRNEDAKKIAPVYEALTRLSSQLSERKSALENEEKILIGLEAAQEKYKKLLAEVQIEQPQINALEKKLVLWKGMEKYYSAVKEAESRREALKNNKVLLLTALESYNRDENQLIGNRNGLILQREEILSVYQAQLDLKKSEKSELLLSERLGAEIKNGESTKAEILKSLEKILQKIELLSGEKKSAEEEYERAYSLHIASLALNLSAVLRDGAPCPVCGSVHHPAPAVGEGENHESDLNRLRAEISRHENELSKLSAEKSGLETRLENGELYLSERRDHQKSLPAVSAERLAAVSGFIADAEKKIAMLPDISRKISQAESDLASASEKKNALSQKLLTAESGLSAAEEKLRLSKEQLDGEFSDIDELNAAVGSAERRVADYARKKERLMLEFQKNIEEKSASAARFEQAKAELLRCEKEHSECDLHLKNSLLENNFSQLSEYLSAAVLQTETILLQKEYDSYFEQKSFIIKSLCELEERTKGLTEPEVGVKSAELAHLEENKALISSELAVLKEKSLRFKELSESYKKGYAVLEEKSEQAKRLKAFGAELRGDRGIGLRRFVLGIMLENVLYEANRILSGIKGGQFRLKKKQVEADNRKTGLELVIESTKTDEAYDVAALSGGEKFLVAISLSLALSSVVQMQAGGVSIDAMFIDEGFGTLDSSALDEVMEILVGIKGTKRLFGIISHVEALKETIPSKIEVINDRGGSRIITDFSG